MTGPDPDAEFVDELLRTTQETLADPRIRYIRVHHASAPPTGTGASEAAAEMSAASRAAWDEAVQLGVTLCELWLHAWLPGHPNRATVRFADTTDAMRVELTAESEVDDPSAIDTATDRLVVRGFLPDDDGRSSDHVLTRRGTTEITLRRTERGLTIAISDVVGADGMTLDTLAGLPAEISLTDTN